MPPSPDGKPAVEGLSEEQATRRDACAGGVTYLVESRQAEDEPGRVVFHIRRFHPQVEADCHLSGG